MTFRTPMPGQAGPDRTGDGNGDGAGLGLIEGKNRMTETI